MLNLRSVTTVLEGNNLPTPTGRKQAGRSGTQAIRKIPEGYVIIEMYTTSHNGVNPNRPGVDINGERYWPVKIKRKSTGRTKWVNLHEDEPTVRAFVKKTMAIENAARPNR